MKVKDSPSAHSVTNFYLTMTKNLDVCYRTVMDGDTEHDIDIDVLMLGGALLGALYVALLYNPFAKHELADLSETMLDVTEDYKLHNPNGEERGH